MVGEGKFCSRHSRTKARISGVPRSAATVHTADLEKADASEADVIRMGSMPRKG